MPATYVVSIRRDLDHAATRAAAYAHVGLSVEMKRTDDVTLADSFTEAGFGTVDIAGFIDGIHALATDPASVDVEIFEPFADRGGVDSEGHATSLLMFSLGGPDGSTDWLACAEVAHTVWPRLLDVLGASVNAMYIEGDGHRNVCLPGTRVPKALRLKSGWDYDAEGNQVRLPLEEAWRRLVAHNEARTGESNLGPKTMRKIRGHMEDAYAGR